jgi:hypothetical protein
MASNIWTRRSAMRGIGCSSVVSGGSVKLAIGKSS